MAEIEDGAGVLPTWPIRGGDTWRGEDWAVTDPATGDPIDLVAAGWSNWRAQWRPTAGTSQVIDLEIDDSQAASGILTRKPVSAADTMSMGGPGGYDVKADDADGQSITWLTGSTTWVQDYTR